MKTESPYCKNCHHPIPQGGKFCPCCGQKNIPTKIPFWPFLGELIQDAFSLDSKVIKSIPLLLFTPGELTLRFFKGQRKKFVSPIRLFLFLTIILFAALQFSVGDIREKFNAETIGENPRFEMERDREHNLMVDELDSTLAIIKNKFNNPELNEELDSNFKFMNIRRNTDSLNTVAFSFGGDGFDPHRFASEDVFLMDIDSLMDFYEIPEGGERFFTKKIIKINKDGGSFMEFLFQRSAWAIFLLMPFLALFLKLIYVRRKRYYIEHVIFSLHFHAFMFLLLALWMLIMQSLGAVHLGAYFIISGIYLYIALKRFYKQSYIKTFFKYVLVINGYAILSILSGILFALIGLAIY